LHWLPRLSLFGLAVRGVPFECARQRELPELVPNHVFSNEHWHVLPPVMYGDSKSNHFREDHRAPGPGLDRPFAVLRSGFLDLFPQVMVDEWSFLD